MGLISYMDDGILYENINNHTIDKRAVYDFTFDDQYIVYHIPVASGYEYFTFDYYTKKGSAVIHTKSPIPKENYDNMQRVVGLALTYTGRRYDLELR